MNRSHRPSGAVPHGYGDERRRPESNRCISHTDEPEQLTLDAHARATDPETSHAAARSITSDKLRASQQAVLAVLRARGPMTDEQLLQVYREFPRFLPKQSDSGLRTRRKELADARRVFDTGERERLASGRQAIVWAAA